MSNTRRIKHLSVLLRALLAITAAVHLLALLATWATGTVAQAAPVPTSPAATPTLPAAPPVQATAPAPAAPTPAPPTIVAGPNGANVRTGPGTSFARVGYLEPGAAARVVGHYVDWWQVKYRGQPAWVYAPIVIAHDVGQVEEVIAPPTPVPSSPAVIPPPAEPAAIDEPRWVDVDLTRQVLTAYEGDTPVRSTPVSTGLPDTPTPEGQFRIWIKLRTDDMAGADYYIEDVPYVMYFYEGYGLHGVTWHGNFGHPMSHGCVNLPTPEAEWLFNWAEVGTLVNIHS